MDTQPDRGEVLNAPHRYTKGDLPVSFPPAVLIGDPSAPATGHPPLVPPAGLLGSIDVRCYLAGGVPVPSPVPVLWLRPQALGSPARGQPLTAWPDSSVYGNDAATSNPAEAPLADTSTYVFVSTTANDPQAILTVGRPLRLKGGYSVYLVASVAAGSPALAAVILAATAQNARWLLGLGSVSLFNRHGALTKSVVTGANYGTLHLFSVRWDGVSLRFRRDDTSFVAIAGGVYDDQPYDIVTLLQTAATPPGGTNMLELQVFDQFLPDDQDASLANALRVQYGLP